MKRYAIGVDMGGTNTRIALVERVSVSSRTDARVVACKSCPTRRLLTPRALVAEVGETVRRLVGDARLTPGQVSGIGIGAPGSVDVPKGLVHFLPNVPRWRNVPLARLVARKTGMMTRVDNDANAMAQGEFKFGAAHGARNAIFLTLGTGVGGGLLVNGELFHGSDFSAAEIGHIRYNPSGEKCACGARGCIETEMGNSYLMRRLEADLKRGEHTVIQELVRASADKKPRLEMVTQAAQEGDRYAIRFWRRIGETLGDFLGGLCNLLNPETVVIGGGIAQAGRFLFVPLKASLRKNAFPAASGVRIVPARLGLDAGLIGAASLVYDKD